MKHYIQTTLVVSLLLALHTLTHGQTVITYDYDANGNRVLRKVVHLRIKQQNDTIPTQDETLALLEEENEKPLDQAETEEQDNDDEKKEAQILNETEPLNEESPAATTSNTEVNNDTAPESSTNQQTSATASTPTQTGINALKNQVTVYPNPTRGTLSIQGNTNETTIQLQLRDMNGKLISERQLPPQSTTHVNMRNQPNGNYILQLIAPNKTTETITIIKTE